MRFALVLCLAAAAYAADDAALAQVNAVMTEFRDASLKGDRATLERLLHPDLTYEHSSAKTETKAEMIASATKPGGAPKGVDFHDGTTHIYGDTAVYKGRLDLTSAAGAVSHLDVLMVWYKAKAGWQLVARHSTKVE